MKPLYVVEVQWADVPGWQVFKDFPSGQARAYLTRKKARDERQRMIYNSPYFAPKYIRVRKYAAIKDKP
jgi:hypothetical protein